MRECVLKELGEFQVQGLLVLGPGNTVSLVVKSQDLVEHVGSFQLFSHRADVLRCHVRVAPSLDDEQVSLDILHKVDR